MGEAHTGELVRAVLVICREISSLNVGEST